MSVMTTKNQNATSKQTKLNNARCQFRKRLSKDHRKSIQERSSPALMHVADSGTLKVNAGYVRASEPGAATQRAMNSLVLLGIGL
jgi:hypothetical protein